MTYYQVDRIVEQYVLEAQYNEEINDTWGPEADVAVINKSGTSLITTADKQKAANAYVGYLYFTHLRQKENAEMELAKFDKIFADYAASLTTNAGANLIIKTQAYRTYPLNENATPYSSIKGPASSVDDSDM